MAEMKKWVGYGSKRRQETVRTSTRILQIPLEAEAAIARFVFGDLANKITFSDKVLSKAKRVTNTRF